jgi:hypothetical protein
LEKIFKVTGIFSEMDGSEDFMFNEIDNESESNDNVDNSSISMSQTC